MDDTFLAASSDRFRNAKKVLENLAKNGWQIVYFSAKEHDIDELKKITQNEVITLSPLP